jgi:hypothetical protein
MVWDAKKLTADNADEADQENDLKRSALSASSAVNLVDRKKCLGRKTKSQPQVRAAR